MKTNTHAIIPDDEDHCVWMDAGLVDYKLCNCRFECETCPFDTVMKEQHHTFAEQAARNSDHIFSHQSKNDVVQNGNYDDVEHFLEPFRMLSFPDDRIYFSNHTWLKSMDNGTVRLGIDAFLAQLLFPLSGVATIHTPSHIDQGEPYAWIFRESFTYAVHNNEKGIATLGNPRLMVHPSLVTSDPYDDGWLVTLSSNGNHPGDKKYFAAGGYVNFINERIEELSDEMKKNKRSVGATMYDGGVHVESIEKFIGEKRYNKIILRLMSPHFRS